MYFKRFKLEVDHTWPVNEIEIQVGGVQVVQRCLDG